MISRTVSILGCGWLGWPLGNHLRQAGYLVKGSTTTQAKLPVLARAGITPYHLLLHPQLPERAASDFFNAGTLVIALPPQQRTKSPESYLRQIEQINQLLAGSPVRKVIYISATSVYFNHNAVVRETDVTCPSNAANPLLARAEALLKDHSGREVTIIRCAGLMGYNRIPGKYFAGRTLQSSGEGRVNYIHRDDAVRMIYEMIASEKALGTFNLVAPGHPTHKAVYLKNAATFGFAPPVFASSGNTSFKIVDGSKLTKVLRYHYLYPDPLAFFT